MLRILTANYSGSEYIILVHNICSILMSTKTGNILTMTHAEITDMQLVYWGLGWDLKYFLPQSKDMHLGKMACE